jgi:hypothetical protein
VSTLTNEILRRRTSVIICHLDAGKTTLPEKLLLFGGAIQFGGREGTRRVRSDWMAVERERGLSVSSAAMRFDQKSRRLILRYGRGADGRGVILDGRDGVWTTGFWMEATTKEGFLLLIRCRLHGW